MYWQRLLNITGKEREMDIPPCIADLVENGLSPDRFTAEEYKPGRHEITLFLAAWSRRYGLEAEIYRDWLIDYSIDVLGVISSSSPSQIRHSTKSTIKYVQRSNVAFTCDCEHNIFKAACTPSCPLYGEMEIAYRKKLEQERKQAEEFKRMEEERRRLAEESKPSPEELPVRQRYKKQFEEAVGLIQGYLKQGRTKKAIAALLNEQGYKTSTGFTWKATGVSNIAMKKGWSPKRKRRKQSTPVQSKLPFK